MVDLKNRGLYIDIEDDIEAEIASNLDINPEEFKAELACRCHNYNQFWLEGAYGYLRNW